MTIAEKIIRAKTDCDEVYEAGKQASYDEFWDNVQKKGSNLHYLYAFAGAGWSDATYNPKYPIKVTSAGNGNHIFYYAQRITDTKVPIDLSKATTNLSNMFANSGLVTIRKIIFGEGITASWATQFTGCSKLENITAEGVLPQSIDIHWSTKLSRNSIESLIGVLSDTVSGKTATFSTVAVNKAFETSEGANDGSASAEWTALVNTKTNWTISLV